MKSLSTLAKFLGLHDDFKELVRNYGLRWAGKSSDELLIERLTRVVDAEEMFGWMRLVKREVPKLSAFIDFLAVTGLRFEEAINSWNLIVRLTSEGELSSYYVRDRHALEHFRFKDVFIRRSKKAFVSIVPEDLVRLIGASSTLTKDVVVMRVKRRKIRQRFSDVRELNASVLTKYLREPEIDFLHGRVSASVFMRNYFNPAWISDLQVRALKAASEILAKISEAGGPQNS